MKEDGAAEAEKQASRGTKRRKMLHAGVSAHTPMSPFGVDFNTVIIIMMMGSIALENGRNINISELNVMQKAAEKMPE